MWGIIPAAGLGSRIQPLAFSKELLPVGSQIDGQTERPRAVSEYLVERMIIAGVDKICFVIAPGKSDIMDYYGGTIGGAHLAYVVQPYPKGLCDAVFSALPLISDDETVVIGLPDTIWFPQTALRKLPDDACSLLLFPVDHPELFDSVIVNREGIVARVDVKSSAPASNWIWGAMKMPGSILRQLFRIWERRERTDQFLGPLFNSYIEAGGIIHGATCGTAYVDVGTLHGYREAIRILSDGAGGAGIQMTTPVIMTPGVRGRMRRSPRIERS